MVNGARSFSNVQVERDQRTIIGNVTQLMIKLKLNIAPHTNVRPIIIIIIIIAMYLMHTSFVLFLLLYVIDKFHHHHHYQYNLVITFKPCPMVWNVINERKPINNDINREDRTDHRNYHDRDNRVEFW